MMQSILLSTLSNSQASERLSDTSAVDKQPQSEELSQQEGELAGRFSDLLGSAIANEKGEKGSNGLAEEELVEVDELASELLFDTLSNEAASEISAEEFALTSGLAEEELVEVDELASELLFDTLSNEAASEISAEEFALISAGQAHPLLAQIEAAQKMDTQLTESQKTAQLSSDDLGLSGQLRKGQEGGATVDIEQLSVSGDSASLKTEMPLQITDKQNELLFTNNSEIDKNALSHAVDSGVLRSTEVNSSGLGKVVNQNMQTAPTSSAALQQPLDIQEKHASALLGERVLMMINQGKQEVQIRLDPAELGSMYIKLQVQQDQLQLSIQTEVGKSRELIEQNLPKLREQLAQQGISLGEASVEQHAQGQQQNANHQGKNEIQHTARSSGDSALQIMDDNLEWIASKIPLPAQGIDYYA